jgi:hypothetical protein
VRIAMTTRIRTTHLTRSIGRVLGRCWRGEQQSGMSDSSRFTQINRLGS